MGTNPFLLDPSDQSAMQNLVAATQGNSAPLDASAAPAQSPAPDLGSGPASDYYAANPDLSAGSPSPEATRGVMESLMKGTPTTGVGGTAYPASQWQQDMGEALKVNQNQNADPMPTMAGRRPNVWNLVTGLFGKRNDGVSRTQVFEQFMGNFLNSMSQGMQAGGTGPGANMRALGAGIQAPYRTDMAEWQGRQEQAQRQAQIDQDKARTGLLTKQAEMAGQTTIIRGPDGTEYHVPNKDMAGILKSQFSAQARTTAADKALEGTLLKIGMRLGPDGKPENVPGNELPLPIQSKLALNKAVEDVDNARAEYLKAQNDPTSPVFQLKKQQLDMAKQRLNLAAAHLSLAQRGLDLRTSEQALKVYDPAMGADFRLAQMRQLLPDALKGDQQAMISLLYNHIGMTLGAQKGARITKDVIHEAQQSAPWLQGLQAKYDSRGLLSGVTLTPEQMRQMLGLAENVRVNSWRKSDAQITQLGLGPDARPQAMEGLEEVPYGATSPLNRVPQPQRGNTAKSSRVPPAPPASAPPAQTNKQPVKGNGFTFHPM